MSYKKKITFKLSVKDIKRAQKELQDFKQKLNRFVDVFCERMANEGASIMAVNIREYNAVDTSTLVNSIKVKQQSPGRWIIYTKLDYALFVEFGTGIKGQEEPHPEASTEGYKYDVNGHGDEGWVYPKDGNFYWTKGQPAKPFMYDTKQELFDEKRVNRIANEAYREVFG